MKTTISIFTGIVLIFLGLNQAFALDKENDITGMIRSAYTQYSEDNGTDKTSYSDMTSDAKIGFHFKHKDGDWTSKGVFDFEIESVDASLYIRNVYVSMENNSFQATLGRQNPSGLSVGNKYLEYLNKPFIVGKSFGRGDFISMQWKPSELTFIAGQNEDTNTHSSHQITALFWKTKFGSIPLKAGYTHILEDVTSDGAVLKHGTEFYDAFAVGFGIPLPDSQLSINLDNMTNTYANSDKPNRVYSIASLTYDYNFQNKSGFTIIYGSKTTVEKSSPFNNNKANTQKETRINTGYKFPHGPISFFVEYSSQQITNKIKDKKIKTSQAGFGMVYDF